MGLGTDPLFVVTVVRVPVVPNVEVRLPEELEILIVVVLSGEEVLPPAVVVLSPVAIEEVIAPVDVDAWRIS
jgi:hypothetical protein